MSVKRLTGGHGQVGEHRTVTNHRHYTYVSVYMRIYSREKTQKMSKMINIDFQNRLSLIGGGAQFELEKNLVRDDAICIPPFFEGIDPL